jgi:glycine cleavage system H lipoate-binding protein
MILCCDLHRRLLLTFCAALAATQAATPLSRSYLKRCTSRSYLLEGAPAFGLAIAFRKGASGQEVKGAPGEVIMTVILVLLTFGIFLAIDYVRGQKQLAKQPVLQAARRETAPRVIPAMVAGFQVPENVRYHTGHTWALSESPDRVRVGMDDFATKLVGKIESITLPQRGRWVRQGQKIWTIFRDGKSVDMVSPIEGTVTDINESVMKDPELARKDPYGDGWLLTVQAPDSKINFRNLLGGTLARLWTEESALRLQKRMPMALAGALAQDGGVAVDDLTAHMPDEDWATLTKEFFLS